MRQLNTSISQGEQDLDVYAILKVKNPSAVLDRSQVRSYFEAHDVNEVIAVNGPLWQREMTPLAFVASKWMEDDENEGILEIMSDLIELGANVNAHVTKNGYGYGCADDYDYDYDYDYDDDNKNGLDIIDVARGGDRIALLLKSGLRPRERHIEKIMYASVDPDVIAEKYIGLLRLHHFGNLNAHDEGLRLLENLVLAGFDVNGQDKNGSTLLHYLDDIEHVSFLVKAGASLDIVNNHGHNPLDMYDPNFIALNASRRDAVQLMVDLGIDLNARFQETDSTALHQLMTFGNLQGIQNLLDAGADPSLRNKAGKQAADMTCEDNDDEQEVREAKALLESAATQRKLLEELGESQQQSTKRRKM